MSIRIVADSSADMLHLEGVDFVSVAMVHSRIRHLYFGAYDEKTGACGSRVNILEENLFNHNIEVEGGVMREECVALLSAFFRNKREQNKANKAKKQLA